MARPEAELRNLEVRNALLDAGIAAFFREGFTGASVGEIVKRAGVPKGSFYYYFDSKDALACEAVGRYATCFDDGARAQLLEGNAHPLDRMRRYFAALADGFERDGFRTGCLLGILGLELADANTPVAARICSEMDRWARMLAGVIDAAKAAGEVLAVQPSLVLARVLISAWEGALLRMRLEKSAEPLREFQTIALDGILKPA